MLKARRHSDALLKTLGVDTWLAALRQIESEIAAGSEDEHFRAEMTAARRFIQSTGELPSLQGSATEMSGHV